MVEFGWAQKQRTKGKGSGADERPRLAVFYLAFAAPAAPGNGQIGANRSASRRRVRGGEACVAMTREGLWEARAQVCLSQG